MGFSCSFIDSSDKFVHAMLKFYVPSPNVVSSVLCFTVKTNDMMLVIYLSSLIRSVIALHNLINNKVQMFSPCLVHNEF